MDNLLLENWNIYYNARRIIIFLLGLGSLFLEQVFIYCSELICILKGNLGFS